MKNIFKNRTVIGIVCIVISLLICFVLLPMSVNKLNEREEYFVAKSNISAGTLITSDMLEKRKVGSYNMPNEIIMDSSIIIGKYAKDNIYKGEFFLSSKLSTTVEKDNHYLYDIPKGMYAISIGVPSFDSGLSGKLQKGDIISIISTGLNKSYIPDELHYVEVLAVTTTQGQDVKDDSTVEDTYKTITLLLNRRQALVMARINHSEKIHVALVSRASEEEKTELLKLQEEIINNLPPLETGGIEHE